MELNVNQLEEISKSKYIEFGYENYFKEDRDVIISILGSNNKFLSHKKNISSLNSLSSTICSKITKQVENTISRNTKIDEMKHVIKSEIVLFLQPERISALIMLLNKNTGLKTWSPSTLESIARTKERDRDVNSIEGIEYYTQDDIKLANQLKTWFQSHIRIQSGKNSKIDWEKICSELSNRGEHHLANTFHYKNMGENFNIAA